MQENGKRRARPWHESAGRGQAVTAHRPVLELLPWYVNGTLSSSERLDVDRHLKWCTECRAEMALLRNVARFERSAVAAPVTPHPARLTSLLRRIEEGERGWVRGARSWIGGIWSPASGVPSGVWLVVAVQTLLVVAVAAFFFADRIPSPEPAYRTLTDPAPTFVGAAPQLLTLRVVFAASLSAEEIRRWLEEHEAEILNGPSRIGVYTIGVDAHGHSGYPPAGSPPDAPESEPTHSRTVEPRIDESRTPGSEGFVARLREDPRVRFIALVGEVE